MKNTVSNAKDDAFERYEALPARYHADPRWETVRMPRQVELYCLWRC